MPPCLALTTDDTRHCSSRTCRHLGTLPSSDQEGLESDTVMAKTDANPPMPEFATQYQLQEVDTAWLVSSVKPKQFLHIDQAECILCEGCVDICPWKCIHMLSVNAIEDSVGTEQPVDHHG